MTANTAVLDPTAGFGSITIQVVVLPRKVEKPGAPIDEITLDQEPDEVLPEDGASPVTSYLERPKGGKLCCVFLVNGQRHDGLDNSFIVQQLGFKYLRNPTCLTSVNPLKRAETRRVVRTG